MLSARQAAEKWLSRSRMAGDAIRAGVNAMNEGDNPLEKAAQKEQQWAEGVQRAAQARKFSTGLRRVSFADWKRAMLDKGIPNYTNGLQSGAGKLQTFLDRFLPYVQEGLDGLRNMPRGTLEQNKQRMIYMVDHLSRFRGRQMGDFNLPGGGRFPIGVA